MEAALLLTSKSHDSGSREPAMIRPGPPTSPQTEQDAILRTRLDRLYPFHALRHTAVTNVYRAGRDLFLAQRFARHVSPLTTAICTHPSDQEMWERLRSLAC